MQMKKLLTIAFAAFVAVALCACGGKDKSDDEEDDDKTEKASGKKSLSQGMYEYYEEVPVSVPGQQDPDVKEASSGKTPYVVDFSATWCGPCQQLKPYFRQMEEAYAGQAYFRTVDIDENQQLAREHGIEGVPTVIIFSDSTMTTELYRVVGFDPQGLEQAIMEFI